ncbi:hypothetical protein PAJ34TS1_00980 [Paenibacillus azoreducens]|uniref:Uncharacterized protein n=1 Tax=Paenibacillus azoreducens TaxID=116718 RepID=A0A919YGC0_9BACL|nr:hypothetical protein J34TS1_35630 [Paenibacillus azoreducens]
MSVDYGLPYLRRGTIPFAAKNKSKAQGSEHNDKSTKSNKYAFIFTNDN